MTSNIEKITINGITIFAETYSSYIILYVPQRTRDDVRRHVNSRRFRFKRTVSAGWTLQSHRLWEFLDCTDLRERDLRTLDKKLDSLLNTEIYSIFEVE